MPIVNTGIAIAQGVGNILKSKKKRRKERRKRKRAKAEAKANERNWLNSGFNPGSESSSEALNMPSAREGDGMAQGMMGNPVMMLVIGFLLWKFLIKKK